jgi:hypothetical protein
MNKILFGLVISAFLFSFTVFSPLPYAIADHVEDPDEHDVIVLSTGILQQVKTLLKAQASNHDKLVHVLEDQILKRKEHLLKLLDKHPDRAMKYFFPAETVSSFPDEIMHLLEVDIELEGEASTVIANFPDGTTKTFYSLKDLKTNKTFNLYLAESSPFLKSGNIVKVTGKKIDDQNIALANGTTSIQTTTVAATTVSGDQPTVVIPINFQDTALPCSDSSVQSFFFSASNSIKNYYAESSFNKVNVVGVVAPRVTIPYNSTDACNYSTWSTAADNLLSSQGFNLNGYTHKVYQFPFSSSCGYIGLGTIGGSPSKAWVFRCDMVDVTAHEYGHNLGWHHASTGTLTTAGDEYGDMSCIMGYSGVGLRHPNSVHKIESGWIPSSRVQNVTSNGTYTLYKSEDGNTTSVQALKVHKADTNEDYYVSFRYPMGFDSSLSSSYSNKVSIHRWGGVSGTKTYLLSNLDNGESFSDPTNGITFQTLSHDTNVAVVSVNLGNAVCAHNAPLVSVSPLSKTGSKGQTLSYTLTVTNKDSSSCPNTTFNLNQSLPSGWSGSFSPTSVSLASSASSSVSWNVTSSSSSLDGTYPVTSSVINSSDVSKFSNTDASYLVFSDLGAPVVTITNPIDGATIATNNVTVKATATDDVKVVKVEFYFDGVVVKKDASAPYSYIWYPKRSTSGLHTITVKAYDGQNNVGTATVSVINAALAK